MAFAACHARLFSVVASTYAPLANSLVTNSIPSSQKYPLEPLLDVDYVLDSHNYLEQYMNADELVPAPYQEAAEKIIAPSPQAEQAISATSLVTSHQAMKTDEVVPVPYKKAEDKMIPPSPKAEQLVLAASVVTSGSGTKRASAKMNVLRRNASDAQKYPLEPLMDVDYVLDSHNYLEKYVKADELVPDPYQEAAGKIIAPSPKFEQANSTASLVTSHDVMKADEVVPAPHQKAAEKTVTTSSQAEKAILAASVVKNVLRPKATNSGDTSIAQEYPVEPLMDVDYVLDSHNYLEKYVKADELVPDPYQATAEKIIAPSSKAEQVSDS